MRESGENHLIECIKVISVNAVNLYEILYLTVFIPVEQGVCYGS